MRFSICDLLWLVLVVAMGLGWWASCQLIDARRAQAVRQTHRHRAALVKAKEESDEMFGVFASKLPASPIWRPMSHVDWSVLDEPLVEP
jgi:hypothetical protein